jgi:Protein of unknown function (DUF4446)
MLLAAVSELTSTEGIVALIACALALVAILIATVLAIRLRRVRAAQNAVLGESGARDLVEHAQSVELRAEQISRRLDELTALTTERLDAAERRLARGLSRASVVRYDAYNEMSGRQSSSIALLDDHGDGVVLSSIHHREQARVYAKWVTAGTSELGISPEEQAAIDGAMSGRGAGEGAPADAPTEPGAAAPAPGGASQH